MTSDEVSGADVWAALSALVRAVEDQWRHAEHCPWALDEDEVPEDAECQCMPLAVDDALAVLGRVAPGDFAERLRLAFKAGAESMRERAANTCERMVIGGRAWTEEQAIAADALFAAAGNVRALDAEVSP